LLRELVPSPVFYLGFRVWRFESTRETPLLGKEIEKETTLWKEKEIWLEFAKVGK